MKSSRTLQLGFELIITFLFLITSTAQGVTPLPTKDSLQHQRVKFFQPYIESVAWVQELLQEDQESTRAKTLTPLSILDSSWLAQATYQTTVPDQWCGFWYSITGNFIDVFPYNVHHRSLHRVIRVAYRHNLALIAYPRLADTIVLAAFRDDILDDYRCQFYQLSKEKFSTPEANYLSRSKRSLTPGLNPKLYGVYRDSGSFWQSPRIKANLLKDKVLALQRTWIIKAQNEVSVSGRRAYRVYVWEEKTYTPAYFLLQKPDFNKNTWVLSLELESSINQNRYYDLGSKNTDPVVKRFNLYWLMPVMGFGLLFYSLYGHRIKVIRKEQSRTQLALSALRAQLNPHFLFNALASIQDLVNQDNKPAVNRYFNEIAQLLRYVVDSSNHAYMPLKQELQALEQYCSLEALRTPFHYTFEVHSDVDQNNTEIPTMLLQPFVENAILHGLRPGTEPKELKISLWPESGNRIGIAIEDNGIGIEEAQRRGQKLQDTRDHQGLANTYQRIALLNEKKREKITLQITDRSHLSPPIRGTLVQLSIPI